MSSSSNINYKSSGVNIDEGNRFISLIKKSVESTNSSNVLSGIGGFAGLFSLAELKDMKDPVLVSGTDGVGTKLKIAIMANKYDTIGIDLVAMSVNDIIVTGAKPLFFLDYLATGKLLPDKMFHVVDGISKGCHQAGCALLGGETAEMPDMYNGDDFDLAGFAVGIVDRENIIDGSTIMEGDVLIGISSSGFHSNGYSLVRNLLLKQLNLDIDSPLTNNMSVGEAMLIPTKIYVKLVQEVLNSSINIKGMVHVTGGGFYDNIPRVLPDSTDVIVDRKDIEVPEVIAKFIELSDINEHELYRVLNMGIGYIFIVSDADSSKVINIASNIYEKAWNIGTVVKGSGKVKIKGIDID